MSGRYAHCGGDCDGSVPGSQCCLRCHAYGTRPGAADPGVALETLANGFGFLMILDWLRIAASMLL